MAEVEESTVYAAVGGARWTGAASPEQLQIEGNAPSNSQHPCLHFLLCPSCSMLRSRFIEIQAGSRCVGVPARGEVLRLPFSVSLGSLVAAAVALTPVWFDLSGATYWLCLGIGSSFFLFDSCALLRIAICDQFGENFGDEFQVMIVAIEP